MRGNAGENEYARADDCADTEGRQLHWTKNAPQTVTTCFLCQQKAQWFSPKQLACHSEFLRGKVPQTTVCDRNAFLILNRHRSKSGSPSNRPLPGQQLPKSILLQASACRAFSR